MPNEHDMGDESEKPNMVAQEVWVSAAPSYTPSGKFTSNQANIGQVLSHEALQAIGAVSLEWSRLDYVMRIACKRLENVGMASDGGREIMGISGHGEIVCRLCNAVAECNRINDEARNLLNQLIITIGKRRRDGLYGRRNQVLHSWWATNERDAWVGRRVGTDEWCKPAQVSHEELKRLHSSIRTAWEELLNLTEPLLNVSDQGSQREANSNG